MRKTEAGGRGCREQDRGRVRRSGKKETERERRESQSEMWEL